MFEIRCGALHWAEIEKAYNRSTALNKEAVKLQYQADIMEPVIGNVEDNAMWKTGLANVLNIIKYGYFAVLRPCPLHAFAPCKGDNGCAWYVRKGNEGDCAIAWMGYMIGTE